MADFFKKALETKVGRIVFMADFFKKALETKVGSIVIPNANSLAPYALTKDKKYEILEVNPLYSSLHAQIYNVLFTILDDNNKKVSVPMIAFSNF